jgi:hypothetical protein
MRRASLMKDQELVPPQSSMILAITRASPANKREGNF